jgi:hypothetical protein
VGQSTVGLARESGTTAKQGQLGVIVVGLTCWRLEVLTAVVWVHRVGGESRVGARVLGLEAV